LLSCMCEFALVCAHVPVLQVEQPCAAG